MTQCKHDLAERETACYDGMCPACLGEALERLRAKLSTAEGCAALSGIGVDAHSALVEISKETMGKLISAEKEIERLTALNRRLVSGDLDIIALCESEQRLEAEIERQKDENQRLRSIIPDGTPTMD